MQTEKLRIEIIRRALLLAALVTVSACANVPPAQPNADPSVEDPAPQSQDGNVITRKAEEKTDRQSQRVSDKVEQKVDEKIDEAVDNVLGRALGR